LYIERAFVVLLSIIGYGMIEITMRASANNPIGIIGAFVLIGLVLSPAMTSGTEDEKPL